MYYKIYYLMTVGIHNVFEQESDMIKVEILTE